MWIGRRLLIALLLPVFVSAAAFAAGGDGDVHKHNLRIGWGDMMFETIAYYPTVSHAFENPSGIPDSYRVRESFNHKFTGHIFAEYRYATGTLFSFGAMLDFESISWERGIFDKNHKMTEALPDVNFYNFVLMPTARITYYRTGHLSLYSGLGAGALLSVAEKPELAPAFYLNAIGVQFGSGHWSGAFDLGLMNAMNGPKKIYMLASRIFSISINYSW